MFVSGKPINPNVVFRQPLNENKLLEMRLFNDASFMNIHFLFIHYGSVRKNTAIISLLDEVFSLKTVSFGARAQCYKPFLSVSYEFL